MGAKKLKFIDGNMVEYEIYDLVDKYDDILHKPTEEFNFSNPQVNPHYLAFSLVETMAKNQGVGLSANQVGLPYRVCVLNMGAQAFVMFNPKIVNRLGVSNLKEGCLSFPGLFLNIPRAEAVTVESFDFQGNKVVQSFDGMAAVCIQHEIDHLDGIFYTKKVSPLTLEREKKKIKKNLKIMKKIAEKEPSVSY
jgi:peptide deformylase